jgi:protein SCO1
VNKRALLAMLVVVLLPAASYFLVKYYGADATSIPKKFYPEEVVAKVNNGRSSTDTVWHRLPEFSFTNQLGKQVSLNDVKGKIVVADFFFTHCPSICPTLTRNMKKMQTAFLKQDRKIVDTSIVHFISFSVDPERDSVSVLKKYADKYGVDHDNWWLLTGSKKDIYNYGINELKMSLQDGEGVDSNFIHTQLMVLIDKNRVIRGYYNGLDSAGMSNLARDIVLLTLEKDKNSVSVFRQFIPVLPLIILGVAIVIAYLIFGSPKKKPGIPR